MQFSFNTREIKYIMYYYCISYLTSVNYYKKFQLFFVREKGITNTREKTAYHEAEKCMKKFKLSITIMAQEQKNLWNYVFFLFNSRR